MDTEAALLPRHERPHHALPDRGGRGGDPGVHADRGVEGGCSSPPPRPPGRGRARRDALPRRNAAALQLRTRPPRSRAVRARRGLPLAEPVSRPPGDDADRLRRNRDSLRVHRAGGIVRHVRPRAGRARLRAARVLGGGNARRVRGDDRLLAQVALALAIQGPLARDGQPLGAHPEAPDVRPDRRHRGRADDEPPGADRRQPQLGLPLHMDPRRGVFALRAAPAGVHG